jgi:hypothetical protein
VHVNFITAAASLAIDSEDAIVYTVKTMVLTYFGKSSIGLMGSLEQKKKFISDVVTTVGIALAMNRINFEFLQQTKHEPDDLSVEASLCNGYWPLGGAVPMLPLDAKLFRQLAASQRIPCDLSEGFKVTDPDIYAAYLTEVTQIGFGFLQAHGEHPQTENYAFQIGNSDILENIMRWGQCVVVFVGDLPRL